MSKLVKIYEKSIFANLGSTVSAMQKKDIPDDIALGEFKTKSILEIQKDFFSEVVLPFGTILENQSNFGDILVNPTEAIIDLFSRVNNDIGLIPISADSNLLKLNSEFDNIRDANATDLLLNSPFPDVVPMDTTSVLNDVGILDTPEFKTIDVLTFNSDFDDIVDFKTTSLLETNGTFSDIPELPYSDVLGLNSSFDDLIIKDIGSVLKVYMASNLPGTTPGVVDFFENINATGFTTEWQQGDSLYNTDTIPPYVEMPQTPDKTILDVVGTPDTPDKPIVDVVPSEDTPEKEVVDTVPMPDPTDKPISDINPPAVTLEKITPDIIEMPATPLKDGIEVVDDIITPDKEGLDVFDGMITPTKEGVDVFDDMITPDKEGVDPLPVNFFPDDKAIGFTLNNPGLITEYNFGEVPSLSQFDFIDNSYGGVLNQYAVFFSRYPPLTNVTYKTVVDWAYRRTIQVPQAQTLFNEGFHTPKVPIGNSQLIVPPYEYANDRLPTWANTYVSTLADAGSTLVAGFLSQQTIELAANILGVDSTIYRTQGITRNTEGEITNANTLESGLMQSHIIFQQLAGEVYWKYSDLGTVVRNAREATINFASNLVGRTLAEQFIPKVESSITGATAALINSILDAPLLDGDKLLMMYHIFMGTKYTKSKAYFDRMAKTYNSKYGQIGDNAVNLYNDVSTYKKYASGDSVNAFGYSIPYIPVDINVPDSLDAVIGISDQDNSISQLKSTLVRVQGGYSETMKIPIGHGEPGLLNPYLRKPDSKTFGKLVETINYYSKDTPDERRQYTYDGPVLTGSMNINYPAPNELQSNPALAPKQNLDALNLSLPTGKAESAYNTAMLTDFSVANRAIAFTHTREDSYYSVLKNKLLGQKLLLEERGFPNIHTNFSDEKNKLNMIKMPSSEESELKVQEFEDTDLIDFYFEDLSSLSDTDESIIIPFRAIITTISDGTNANWSAQDYMGRADKFWIYQGFERRVAINFEVAINSKDEFISSWNKINYLQGMCYPVEYPAEITLKAPIMALTVGNLFNRIQVIMNSINYTFDASTLWEIEDGYQLPMHIKIAVDFTAIFADVPKASARHIAQNQGWADPVLYDWNETNAQSDESRRVLITGESGSLTTVLKSTNSETSRVIPVSEPVTN